MSTDTTRPDSGGLSGHWVLFLAVAVSVAVVAMGLAAGRRYADLSAENDRQARVVEQVEGCAERSALFVARIDSREPLTDLSNRAWEQAPAMQLRLNRQTDTMPILEEATVEGATLQALSDGRTIAWRVSWPDETADLNVDTARFSDAVALQFPVTRGAAHTMGDRGQLVQILHWKGLWQKDLDVHFQDVQDLHPNYWADLYWFAEGEAPYRVPDDFGDPRARQWFVALEAENPFAELFRRRPVEELTAEGFGSLTPHSSSATDGRGVWQDGSWTVIFARPMRTSDPLDYQFWRGGAGQIGLAVWDGSAGNVGGRKHWSNWVEFEVSF